ncbi:suppressor of Mek1-like [Leptopilina heterotoma]|uniref:suppressor of Mek1-like n=1 Tax=Leptopilina heterotoma TaxID=63436 RepID=UPI001CA9B28A|nr:suppressor of Mek1-like [Leptopilina heterotoma]XP_043470298.1 suppressor of Mek1-like [Leptopilina heterotoma]XP_043470299.1 suppressor of Mek1-like [Leptopilina heterotoma]XP_043470300.1 suppressor of Mek1-like [Leptopilina heterotoma]XP_043470301.1 suppressor of Mek1-like [Leptopilina heterotoma]XP_043470302.1 suppressor of Mek1-like [Leptopilina heterotoma]XP_043470303.1 suppressor of Mek1-like [Leptopilina heterotoma]XP_043470304.1 suppressor of Mek1-like [Leptopilina heterotoma]
MGTVSSEKSETMKGVNVDEFPLSLETSKQTRLESSKSLIESNNGTNRNVDVTNISRAKEYESNFEKDTHRKEGHTKSEHERMMSPRNSNTLNETHNGKNDKKFYHKQIQLNSDDFLQHSWQSRGKRKLLYIKEEYSNRKNSITLGKEKDSVCHKMECENTDTESIVSERCKQIKEHIKALEDVTKKDDDIKMQYHRKSRKLLIHKKNIVRCRSKKIDSNDNIYDDNDNNDDDGLKYEKFAKKRNENLDDNYRDAAQDYDYYYNHEDKLSKPDTRIRREEIQYFDYNENSKVSEELSHESQSKIIKKDTTSKKKSKNDDYPIKKNKQKIEDEKQDQEAKKTGNKIPSEEFIGNLNIPDISDNQTLNETLSENSLKTNNLPINGAIDRDKRYEDEDNTNIRNYEKSNVDRS